MSVETVIDLNAFSNHRLTLIEQLESGKLNKTEYIKATLDFYDAVELNQPERIESILQGMYYYQYYNSFAKWHQIQYRELARDDIFTAIEHRTKSAAYYKLKDNITLKMLKLVKRDEVLAYYVKMDSCKLNSKLVEIVLLNYDSIILHTLDKKIIRYLDNKDMLSCRRQNSLIDTYINKKYYEV